MVTVKHFTQFVHSQSYLSHTHTHAFENILAAVLQSVIGSRLNPSLKLTVMMMRLQ